MPLGVLEARMWSVSMVVGVPLQARTVLEMVHLDGRVGLVRPRVARAIRGAVASIFCVQRDPMMRLCVFKHVCGTLLRL